MRRILIQLYFAHYYFCLRKTTIARIGSRRYSNAKGFFSVQVKRGTRSWWQIVYQLYHWLVSESVCLVILQQFYRSLAYVGIAWHERNPSITYLPSCTTAHWTTLCKSQLHETALYWDIASHRWLHFHPPIHTVVRYPPPSSQAVLTLCDGFLLEKVLCMYIHRHLSVLCSAIWEIEGDHLNYQLVEEPISGSNYCTTATRIRPRKSQLQTMRLSRV
jgi:hypothetical protein